MSTTILLYLMGGLIGLVVGGELLIRGAAKIAAALGVSSLVIGLTVVALGTSAPELVVSIKASWGGQSNLAMGNVVGSNIFNLLLILGACAAYAPLTVSSQLVRLDVPVMIGGSILLYIFGLNGNLSGVEGFVLFSGLIIYTVFLIYKSRKETRAENDQPIAIGLRGLLLNLLFILLGLGCLILGGDWFVTGAIATATALGVSETIIGLTVVAAGTSLPEVVTSLIATIRGERDMAIGNVVGSNIYNLLAILGISSLVTPGGLNVAPELFSFDLPIMLGASIACFPIFLAGFRINRWEGVMFLLTYVIYTGFLVLDATNHAYFTQYRLSVIYIVAPILLITIAVISYQAFSTVRELGHD
jgi:cation:H+ antiporter